MQLLDSRRLTGPNLHLPGPAAIAEVSFAADEDSEAAVEAWREAVAAALAALGWPVTTVVRTYDGPDRAGADLVFAAPPEALYLATDINEWAVAAASERAAGGPAPDPGELLPRWRAEAAHEHDPQLDALVAEAAARGLPVLRDEDHVSIGHGRHSRTWPRGELPAIDAVPWDDLRRIPVALITGTNGKTTTARLLARITWQAGKVPGNTSTDGMSVDERLIEAGDWTGPGAARTVLRHPEVDVAVLEVARGGILRRGLAVDCCDAAAVTNVSADHLGDHGVHDLETMARVKLVVASVVAPTGRIVLGADSPPLVDLVRAGHRLPAPLVWFSLAADHPYVAEHVAAGGEAWFVRDGEVVGARGPEQRALVAVAELPLCFGGAASCSVANCLAAAAVASAIGLPDEAIVAGLRSFTSSYADNPGRANDVCVRGVLVFLDFAHNAAGIESLRPLLAALRGSHRLLISMAIAGDRRDEDIRALARAVHALAPDQIRVRDLEHYLRGRAPGEVPAMMRTTLLELGIPAEAVHEARSELDVLTGGLAWAQPGDVVAILDHVDRDVIQAELERLGATPHHPTVSDSAVV